MPNTAAARRKGRGAGLRLVQAVAGLGGGLCVLIGALTAIMGASRGMDLAPSWVVLGIGAAVLATGAVVARLRGA